MEHDVLERVDGAAHRQLALRGAVDVVEDRAWCPSARAAAEVVTRDDAHPRVASSDAEGRRDEAPEVGDRREPTLHAWG
jgi:hypothetical protein